MNYKLLNAWHKYKYDVYFGLTWIVFYIAAFERDVKVYDWRYWVLLGIVVLFRVIGYKEGKRNITRAIMDNDTPITVDINIDNAEIITCELKNIRNGLCFSLVNDESQHKYIKCNQEVNGSVTCWNLTDNKLHIINDDVNCILYKTKLIHLPLFKMKEK